jgi:hypothetical protein
LTLETFWDEIIYTLLSKKIKPMATPRPTKPRDFCTKQPQRIVYSKVGQQISKKRAILL